MVSKPFSSGFQMKKSPWEATWRSMAIPGWGQYYTEQYWKVPLILGGVGFLLYKIIGNNNLYLNYDRQYSSGNLQGNDLALALNYREFYRDVRDEYGLYLLALYLVNIIDAYVDAHLFDFDVSDKLGAQLQLMPTGRFGISVRW